jgi:hypothetical protein
MSWRVGGVTRRPPPPTRRLREHINDRAAMLLHRQLLQQ